MESPFAKSAPTSPTLRQLAEHLNLSPATVSLVVNNAPGIRTIAMETRARVLKAAKQFNYRPNSLARSLRTRQTFTIGVIVPELSEGYFTLVMNAVEAHLLQAGYLHFVVCHQGQPDLIEEYPKLLMNRFVDGLMLINTDLGKPVSVPVVSISGHKKMSGTTNLCLDHDRSAVLALEHLYALGHRRIAFMKGQRHASDSDSRWESTMRLAREFGIEVRPELCVFLETNAWSPELGYNPTKNLLERTRDFTALFCFNDIAALGAIRAIADSGLSCPRDISVVGFDDISQAAYHLPSLTTVRQPLREMGHTAAEVLIKRIQSPNDVYPVSVTFAPELKVRESTGPPPQRSPKSRKRVGTKQIRIDEM
jgi:DNA-binding LacI/PurR family transcriptional regulator